MPTQNTEQGIPEFVTSSRPIVQLVSQVCAKRKDRNWTEICENPVPFTGEFLTLAVKPLAELLVQSFYLAKAMPLPVLSEYLTVVSSPVGRSCYHGWILEGSIQVRQ